MTKYELIEPVIYTTDELLKAYESEDNPTIFDRVDNIIIQSHLSHIHLGKVCYFNFKIRHNKKNKKFKHLYAIPSSLDLERVQITKILLKHTYDLLIDEIRPLTINNRLKTIISFFEYLNINNIEFHLERKSIQKALMHYGELLLHQIKIYNKELKIGLTTSTAHNYQKWVLSFSAFILNIDCLELLNSNLLIASNEVERIPTQALSNEIQRIEFNQYTSIFRRFSSIVLDNSMFPFTMELNAESYWITPTGKIVHKDNEQLTKSGTFNFQDGREYSVAEIIASNRYKKTSKRNEAIKLSKQKKAKANTPYSNARLFIAINACRAYFMHFLFLTGENDSTAASILFCEDYNIENSEKNFKSIKWRANNRTVKYDIQTEFIDDFKQYLRLRSYLLNYYNEKHEELFLDILSTKLVAAPSNGKFSSKIRINISSIFKENSFIATSKTIRVTKGLWIRNNHGSSLSSYILQHSKKASNVSYTGANFEESSKELTNYFGELTNQLLISPGIEKSTPSGNCVEPNMPLAISEIASNNIFTIDCGDQKSCLFCSKYRIHGDEKDIRKLLSMKYLIIQSEHLAASIEHFNRIYKSVLIHIEELLDQIRALGEEQVILIIDIHKQVFEQEELSDYWYRKLELLDELGVL